MKNPEKLKVLFVGKGKSSGSLSPLLVNQAESLIKFGVEIGYYTIRGDGLWGYIKNIPALRKKIKSFHPQLVHPHYSSAAIATSLSGKFRMVVSLMGSDVYVNKFMKIIIRLFSRFRWSATIVKSEEMKTISGLNGAFVVPNGVDLDVFKPMEKDLMKNRLGLEKEKQYILFASDPMRKEKYFELAKNAISAVESKEVELLVIHQKDSSLMPQYINACDLVLLTSTREGSPNIVKEAMACNVPVISTDVGDVRQNFEGQEGYYICNPEPHEIAGRIRFILETKPDCKGRERLKTIGLDSANTAKKLTEIYQSIL